MPDFGAIVTLFARYAAANDWPDQSLLESCFTEDATFELHIAGADSLGPFNGRAAIVDFFMPILNGQTDTRKHVITNYNLKGDGRVNAYLSLLVTDGGETVLKSAGLYETEIVDGEDGPRLRSMTLSLDSGF
jgi:ketosteroid isomerase-like protein